MLYDMEVMNELMAQTYAAAIRWPKDKILEIRLLHVMSCVEHGVWPVPDDYALGDHLEEEVRCQSNHEVVTFITGFGLHEQSCSTG